MKQIKHELVRIPCGIFAMGGNEDRYDIHTVVISKSFYIDNTLVTQKMYEDIMGINLCKKEHGLGDDYPVYNVSWHDAVKFCNRRSEKENFEKCYTIKGKDVTCDFSKNGYRLPTEAEWEYSCRAGSGTECYWGNEIDNDYCWHSRNSKDKTHPVGLKKPNNWGLYDMSGNILEWCWDWYDECYYKYSPGVDPKGAGEGDYRVSRGGSWHSSASFLRSVSRSWYFPDVRYSFIGSRCVSVR